MTAAYFVTGTDTGVGKTAVTCGLLRAFVRAGRRAVGMKPVAAGSENGRWEDVERHRAAGNVAAPRTLVNPIAFDPPIAPHIAAEAAGATLRIEPLAAAFRELCTFADVVVIEGAGGFMIPLNARETSADLARALGAPVVLVVGMRLGCLSHALLTQEAILARGLAFAGWVANVLVSDMPYLERNVAALTERLRAPCVGVVPHRLGLTDDDVADQLKLAKLAA
jgi:dethiobiotin synthetase